MIIHRGLQALLLNELMNVAFVLLIDLLEAAELLLLELAKALVLAESVVFRRTEVFTWPESGVSHLERTVSSEVLVRVWKCFIHILVDKPRVFFVLLFLSFCVLFQKEILLQDLLVKSQNLLCKLLVLSLELSQLGCQLFYLALLLLIRAHMPANFLLVLLHFGFPCGQLSLVTLSQLFLQFLVCCLEAVLELFIHGLFKLSSFLFIIFLARFILFAAIFCFSSVTFQFFNSIFDAFDMELKLMLNTNVLSNVGFELLDHFLVHPRAARASE